MADEATAGNAQPTEETQVKAGEGQSQEPSQPAAPQKTVWQEREWTPEELVAELDNTNTWIKQNMNVQPNQEPQPQAQPQPVQAGADDDLAQYGVTQEQKKLIQRLAGTDTVDELKNEISELKKERENERQQQQQKELDSEFSSIAKEFKDSGVPLPTTIGEKQKLISYMNETRIFNPRVAFEQLHASRLQKPAAEKPKAATSDKSDEAPPMNENAYREALKGAGGDPFKIAQVETQFKGNPTEGAWS